MVRKLINALSPAHYGRHFWVLILQEHFFLRSLTIYPETPPPPPSPITICAVHVRVETLLFAKVRVEFGVLDNKESIGLLVKLCEGESPDIIIFELIVISDYSYTS